MQHKTIIHEKMKESLASVLPIACIVLVLSFTVSPMQSGMMMAFLFGTVLLVAGTGFFTLGADIAMTPIGEMIGSDMTKSRNLPCMLIISFILGVIITISEPDLAVLASQIPAIPSRILIYTVGAGVGIFLCISIIRIFTGIRLKHLLAVLYGLLLLLSFFVTDNFKAIAFDSGGVTTGPMTVPFIMAFGIGVSRMRSDQHGKDDSFGLVALSSIGPILAVMLLGMRYDADSMVGNEIAISNPQTTAELAQTFLLAFPEYLKEAAAALAPILIFFLLMNCVSLRLDKVQTVRILIGIIYTYVGLVLFLTGVNAGFLPAGYYIGKWMAGLSYRWILVPVGMIMGYFIVTAEPAVHVLTKQVNEITAGSVSGKALLRSLSIGMAISLGLSIVRVLAGISVMWFLIPGYLIAVILSFFVPDLFAAIAFDAGGVVSGPMTAAFLLPLAIGVCEQMGGNLVTDAFGMVAMIAMTPLTTIQVMGAVSLRYLRKGRLQPAIQLERMDEEDIIEFL